MNRREILKSILVAPFALLLNTEVEDSIPASKAVTVPILIGSDGYGWCWVGGVFSGDHHLKKETLTWHRK